MNSTQIHRLFNKLDNLYWKQNFTYSSAFRAEIPYLGEITLVKTTPSVSLRCQRSPKTASKENSRWICLLTKNKEEDNIENQHAWPSFMFHSRFGSWYCNHSLIENIYKTEWNRHFCSNRAIHDPFLEQYVRGHAGHPKACKFRSNTNYGAN